MRGPREGARRLTLGLALIAAVAGTAANAQDASGARVALGSYVPKATWRPAQIDHYTRLMGRQPAIVGYYKQWDFAPFVGEELRRIWNRGSVPMVTWEPMSYHGRRYPLRKIARGGYDSYVRRAARATANWGKPVFVRFAHEMNGDWYPWGRGSEGNTPQRYRTAWRRIVRIFRRAGAHNVRWVWTPNVNQFGRIPFQRYFPGDRWVDWVGLDGFNWGYGGSDYSFMEIFGRSYRVLARLSRRPVMIAETGTNDRRKARWIRKALRRQLLRLPRIRALVWFNHPVNGVDLRFNSSAATLRTFRRATRAGPYRATRAELLGTPRRFPRQRRAGGR